MARRKRLTPPQADFLKSRTDPPALSSGPLAAPPIAQVAGDVASSAALEALSEEIRSARSQGRLIENLPLDAVDATYLVRDRIAVADEDQEALLQSLRSRGQQTAIEVVDLGSGRPAGRYGLISGWRRLTALRNLHKETGDPRFGSVLARITQPGEAPDAYLAMVEENEIRVGLSHYERARIAVRAVDEGVFRHDRAALDRLYSSASRAKKSKIKSFVSVVRQLDGTLHFPSAIGERLGLDLARRLAEDSGFAGMVSQALAKASPGNADAEQLVLKRALRGEPARRVQTPVSGSASAPEQKSACGPITLQGQPGEIRLAGPGVTPEFQAALQLWIEAWIAGQNE